VKNVNAKPRRKKGSSSLLPSSNAAVTTVCNNNNSKVGLASPSPSMVSVNNGVRAPETHQTTNNVSRAVPPAKSNPISTMSSAKSSKNTLPGVHQDQHNSMIKNVKREPDDNVVEISSRPSSAKLTTAPTSITRSPNEGKILSSQENRTRHDQQGGDSLLRGWEKFVGYERPTVSEVEAEKWQEKQRVFNILSNFDEWAEYATEDYEHLTWTTMHNMFSDVEEVTLF
ncbi:hypothetical protein MKX03_000435, partial [Papaver bracteatum]